MPPVAPNVACEFLSARHGLLLLLVLLVVLVVLECNLQPTYPKRRSIRGPSLDRWHCQGPGPGVVPRRKLNNCRTDGPCHPVVIGSRCRTGHCCPRTRSPLVAEGSALRHNQDFVLRSYTAVCDKTALIGHKPYRPPPNVGWSGRFICWVMLLPGSVSRVAWPPLDAALLPNLERLLVTRTRSPASHSH